jgi:ubiquinone/menaquinone biosynthesis C-methylase UbiE
VSCNPLASLEDQNLARFREREHAGWQKLAGGYDTYFQQLVIQAIEPLLDAASVEAGIRVLDLCCGPGYVAARALRRGALPTGVDFSSAMIALAKQHYPSIDFQEGDAEQLRFPDGTFDAVVVNFGLHHLAQPQRAMTEAARVLRPGGRVACNVWAKPDKNTGQKLILDAVESHGRLVDSGGPPAHFQDAEASHRMFASVGLVDVAVRTLHLIWDLPAPYGVFDAYRAGGVRTEMLLSAHPPETLSSIREAVARASIPYQRGNRLQVPMACVLATAMRDIR